MANKIIAGTAAGATALPVAGSVDRVNDFLPIYTAGVTATQAITPNNILGITGAPIGDTDTQTLSNKTLGATNNATLKDSSFTLQSAADSTKKVVFDLTSITTGNTRTIGFPDASGTLVLTTLTQTLTNKTLTSPTINTPTITNATITADTYAGFTTSNSGTIYGISVTTGQISSALTLTSSITVTGASTLSSTLSVTGQPSFLTATAPPAAGSNTVGLKFSSTANLGVFFGSGAPTFSAAQGSIYLRTDGSSTSTRLYVNTTGSTTWTNFTSAA